MKPALVARLRCPRSRQALQLRDPRAGTEEIESGSLVSEDGQYHYSIRRGIPRFVPESNYADNFGLQWNHFSKTQLDSYSGHPISATRFWNATGWHAAELKDQWVLDVGCGAGRFAEIALTAGAHVVALDYSSAVDACLKNLGHHPNLHVVQGDIYALPFAPGSFSFVYSLGVLQHTPDVARAFAALPPMMAAGGHLCVDYYEKSMKSRLLPKYWLRPVTKRLPKPTLFAGLERIVPGLLHVSSMLGRIPLAGGLLQRLVPVANYDGILPLDQTQLREWALLDTFDWFAPAYDQPQNAATARTWCEQAGLSRIEILKAGHLVARGMKSA